MGQAIATHNAAALGLLLRAFWILYDDHGWLHDAVTLFGRAAAALQGTPGAEAVRGHLLGLQSYFLTRVACYRDARIVVEEALAILRASGATDGLAAVLVYYGVSLCHLGHLNAAREYFGQAAELARADNDHFLLLWSHFWLAVIAAFWGDYETAERYVKGFLTAFRGHGYSRGEGIGLVGLAEIARCRGQYDQAASHLHDAMRVGSAAHDSLTIGACLCQLGALALQRDELNEARYLLEESAALSRELGDPWHLARALAFLVRVEVKLNNHQAARLACAELTRIAVDGEAMMLGDAISALRCCCSSLATTPKHTDCWMYSTGWMPRMSSNRLFRASQLIWSARSAPRSTQPRSRMHAGARLSRGFASSPHGNSCPRCRRTIQHPGCATGRRACRRDRRNAQPARN